MPAQPITPKNNRKSENQRHSKASQHWRQKVLTVSWVLFSYLAIARLSQSIFYQSDPTPIWLPAGLALVAVLWCGPWGLLGIGIGELAFNLIQGHAALTNLLLTIAVVLQAWVGAWCLKRSQMRSLLSHPHDILGLFLLATFASTWINSTLSVVVKLIQQAIPPRQAIFEGLTFWFGDSLGILILVPLLLTLPNLWPAIRRRRSEASLCFALIAGFSLWSFTTAAEAVIHHYHSEYFIFPLMVWASVRLGLPGAALSSFLTSAIAILGVRAGVGPFVAFAQDFGAAVLSVQLFMIILTVTALILATAEMQLRQVERQRANLARYFAPSLVNELAGLDTPLGNDRRQQVAVLYADITGFTTLLDAMKPEAALEILRFFHAQMEARVFEHQGTLERYTGEGLVAVFGVPQVGYRDATNALACARAMMDNLATWNAKRLLANEPPILVGIGIDYGSAVMGNVGTERNMTFMVAGKVSKIAVRLKDLCTRYQADICISKAFQEAVKRERQSGNRWLEGFTSLGQQHLLGLSAPVTVLAMQGHMQKLYAMEQTAPDAQPSLGADAEQS